MNKKGFTLVELVSSIALLSIVLIFLLNLMTNLRKDEEGIEDQTKYLLHQAGTSKTINSDIINNGGINSATCEKYKCNLVLNNGEARTLEITANNTKLIYYSDQKMILTKSLPNKTKYTEFLLQTIDTGHGILFRVEVGINQNSEYNIELTSYKYITPQTS